ncbi:MAG TPA: ISNCY family transposase [archaeon]|nr:ISNCY family transposase [archaeon]
MKGYLTMSAKEADRIAVMDKLIEKRIKQKHAGRVLNLSTRQIRRLMKRYRKEGKTGLIHKSRGKRGNRAIAESKKEEIVSLINKNYSDFGPTLASEKLVMLHDISFSDETIRKIMTEGNLWLPRKKKVRDLHPYRDRRACLGDLIQLDGSPHKWFEDRGPSCTLIAFIDDATSRIMDGAFVDYEGTFTLFEATEHYLKTHGKPLAFYVDKHSTFKINRQTNIEEDLKDTQAQSQFSRAMDELNIEVIFANSPEAKGRVEKLFKTLQDRLVKEMRLKGIKTKEEGTRFFREEYIPFHNSKFAVPAREKANLHKPLLPTNDLNKIFTIQSKRQVSKDLIVRYKNSRYQLLPETGYRYTLKHAAVTIEENRQGKISFVYKDKTIPYRIAVKEVRHVKPVQVATSKDFTEKRIRIPDWNHPWRQMGRIQIELNKNL